MRGLSGIEDEKTRWEIWRSAVLRCSRIGPFVIASILILAALAAVLSVAARPLIGQRGIYVAMIPALFLGAEVHDLWLRRSIRRELPRLLASLGRCAKCGYLVTASTSVRCPECGRPAASEQINSRPA